MYSQGLQLQHLLFQQIKAQSGDQPLANLLAPILHLNPSTIYKRIKGHRPLILSEMVVLAKHFDISIDELIQKM